MYNHTTGQHWIAVEYQIKERAQELQAQAEKQRLIQIARGEQDGQRNYNVRVFVAVVVGLFTVIGIN